MKYNKITPEVAEKLKQIVGAERIQLGKEVREEFSHDEMPFYGRYYPECVCTVESTQEVAEIMKLCNENRIPVTPRGSGTGLAGGAVPLHGGVVISLSRMNKIIGYDMNNMAVRVQVGVLLKDLAEDALSRGLMYPPDPGEKTATLGGNVSTNAGGMRAVKYGVTRDYVLAMKVVLPDGEILDLGKTVCKTSSGYSLLHLMIGSEGTLGIITELTLKLIAKPAMDVSLILPFEDLETCISTVPKIKLANLDPQSIEFMGRDIVESSAAFSGKKIFPTELKGRRVEASILVTFVGSTEDELYLKMEKLDALAEENGAIDTLVVDTPTLKKEVWAARSAFLTAIEADTKFMDELDVVVPVDKIAGFLTFVRSTGDQLGLTVRNFGHAGDGNLHIYSCLNEDNEAKFRELNQKLMDSCYAECDRLGGQVSGEHAIGHAKKVYLKKSVGSTAYELMRQIKLVFDPNEILNPGKVCTD